MTVVVGRVCAFGAGMSENAPRAVVGTREMACSTSATVSVPAAGDEVEWYMYMFAPADAGLRTVDFDMAVTSESGGMSEFEYSFSGIPLVRNHRVNVTIGSASGAGMSLRME